MDKTSRIMRLIKQKCHRCLTPEDVYWMQSCIKEIIQEKEIDIDKLEKVLAQRLNTASDVQ